MIPREDIIAWGVDHPWPELDQIEQDLLLSQAICEISNDGFLGNELSLRGGTAFHKLFMKKPYRYSEDLTANSVISNLHEKIADPQFATDINNLIRQDAPEYDIHIAGEYIEKVLLSKL